MASGATITFDVSVNATDTSSLALEVWSGSACTMKTNRDKNTSCVQVFSGKAETQDVTVKVQDILQKVNVEGAGIDTGTADVCESDSSASGDIPRSLFFMLIGEGDDELKGTGQQWEFNYDLVPPAPPTEVTAGPGENSLTLDFTASEDDDLDRYRFYCVQSEGAADGSSCETSVLVPGEVAPAAVKDCGSTSATAKTSGQTDDELTNGVWYAVAVAAEDKIGNVGVLSNISCAQPQEVTGYFEAYRAAGGQAGGGFCSFAPARRGALPLLGALALGLVAFARRRR